MYSIECVLLQPHPTFHHLSSLSQFPTFHPSYIVFPSVHRWAPSVLYACVHIYKYSYYMSAAMLMDSAGHGYSLPQNPMQRYGFCIFLTNF